MRNPDFRIGVFVWWFESLKLRELNCRSYKILNTRIFTSKFQKFSESYCQNYGTRLWNSNLKWTKFEYKNLSTYKIIVVKFYKTTLKALKASNLPLATQTAFNYSNQAIPEQLWSALIWKLADLCVKVNWWTRNSRYNKLPGQCFYL